MSGGFRLRLLRAQSINGLRMLAGSEVNADAQTARELIESGAARLVDEAELPRLIQAVGARRPAPLTR